MQMDRKTVEEAKKQIEKDLQELQLMFMRNERDLLTMRVQHLKEETDKLENAESAFNEKVESLLIKELEDIERDMGKRKVTEEEFPILTPMRRVDFVVGIYNRLHNKGGSGIVNTTYI